MVSSQLEQVNETPEEFSYSCKRCRQPLFKEADLEEHSSKVKTYNAPSKKVSKSIDNNFLLQKKQSN